MKTTNKEQREMRDFILWWNSHFPIDYWFRKKFNITFGSTQHRELRVIDIKFEYEEDRLIEFERKQKEQLELNRKEYENTGVWIEQTLTEEEDNDLFDKIKF